MELLIALGFIGILSCLVFLIILIVSANRKRSLKKWVICFVASILITVISFTSLTVFYGHQLSEIGNQQLEENGFKTDVK